MPETPEEWRDHLLKKLAARQPAIEKYHRYYDGEHDLPSLPENCANEVKRIRENAVLNLCSLVIEAPMERLEVQGFQFGDGEDAIDVWRDIWQPNQLDADSDLVHTEALISGRAFVLVWPDGDGVTITPESPTEVLVDYEPGSRRKRRAAIKAFAEGDDINKRITDVTVWLPGFVYRWTRVGQSGPWEIVDGSTGPAPARLNGAIPMFEFICNPDIAGRPRSELGRGVIKTQNRINKATFNIDVLEEYQSFPQWWATGIAVEVDDNGNAVRPFNTGPNKLVVNESEGVKFGQWDAADPTPLVNARSAEIYALASQTKTPAYYLPADSLSNVSAEMLRALDAGLVKKVRRHWRVFGEVWEDVIRTVLLLRGDDRATDMSSSIEWGDPETRTMAEEADAAVKLAPLLPQAETWARLGYSPQDRARFEADMMQQAVAQRIATPAEPAVA